MKNLKYVLVIFVMLVSVVRADAEYTDEDNEKCYDNCKAAQSACIARIDLANDVEVQDAKDACEAANQACYNACWLKRNPPPESENPPQEQ